LSIILPVTNAETTLASKVGELLEVVTDLTENVELLIVDNGSTDDTEDVVMELSRTYPQVHALRQSIKTSDVAAARAGILKTTGEMVLIHNIDSPLSGGAIREFWSMRNDEELVFARSEMAHDKLPGMRTNSAWSGTQMLRRSAVTELQQSKAAAQQVVPPSSAPKMKIERVTRTDLGAKSTSAPASIVMQLTDSQTVPQQ